MSIRREAETLYRVSTVAGRSVQVLYPNPLPPEPPIDLEPLIRFWTGPIRALGRLDGSTALLPDTQLFIYLYLPQGGSPFLSD